MDLAQWANTVASGLVCVSVLVFIVTYHRRAPWRSSEVGWLLMSVAASIGSLGAYTVLLQVWPVGPTAAALRVVRTVLLLVIAALMLWQARLVIRAQRRERDGGGE